MRLHRRKCIPPSGLDRLPFLYDVCEAYEYSFIFVQKSLLQHEDTDVVTVGTVHVHEIVK